MMQSLPLLLVPGLTCTARLYGPQIAALWPFGPVTVADHRQDADMAAVAARILQDAPPRFALAGLSMGGYIAFAMLRQAPERIVKLALLDTSARADTAEQTEGRKTQIAIARSGRYGEIPDLAIPRYLNAKHQRDERLTAIVWQMILETGPDAFVRQLQAIMSRPDSRPLLASIRCPTLVVVGDADVATPPELNKEIADGIPGAKLVTIQDSGHLTTIEQPEAVNAALSEWLNA
ncbi:MAG TPA: alpha/beta fold hydrolase [Xanthobacteraceae bacterium]|nr:alpha/beta fold hydrolase [Xanthobacteraceae bacterium]